MRASSPKQSPPLPPEPSVRFLRKSEWVLLIYFAYAAGVSLVLDIDPDIRTRTLAVNGAIIAAYVAMGLCFSGRAFKPLNIVRDWVPFGLVLLCYREMGWLAPAEHAFELEHQWIVWDRVLLHDWGLRNAVESLGAVLPAYLEICYTLVYILAPFTMLMLYAYLYRREASDRFLFIYLLGTLLSYAMFPFFPSEPPRTVFPGADMPQIDTVFRQFNWWLLKDGGIHTSVFPSAHVSASFSVVFGAFLIMKRGRWLPFVLLAVALGIFGATIYGRYHYAVDSIAGVGVSFVALGVARLVAHRRVPTAAAEPALAEAQD